MSFIVVIPARFSSTRFPGKLLADIQGKPMIVRVMEKALLSDAKKVIVATDHIDIINAIKIENTSAEVIYTHGDHQSGTERIEEVINHYRFSDGQIIVNLQGDEPLISPDMINLVARNLLSFNDVSVSTLAFPVISISEIYDVNIVKVVLNVQNYALYFSRSIIPWCKRAFLIDKKNKFNYLRHIGIYSYYVHFIYRYVNWGVSPLEKLESLEQLRILWNQEKIYVSVIDNNINYINVNTPEELNAVNLFLKK